MRTTHFRSSAREPRETGWPPPCVDHGRRGPTLGLARDEEQLVRAITAPQRGRAVFASVIALIVAGLLGVALALLFR